MFSSFWDSIKFVLLHVVGRRRCPYCLGAGGKVKYQEYMPCWSCRGSGHIRKYRYFSRY
jgi:DnaJ-class molecular chaperone